MRVYLYVYKWGTGLELERRAELEARHTRARARVLFAAPVRKKRAADRPHTRHVPSRHVQLPTFAAGAACEASASRARPHVTPRPRMARCPWEHRAGRRDVCTSDTLDDDDTRLMAASRIKAAPSGRWRAGARYSRRQRPDSRKGPLESRRDFLKNCPINFR